MSDKVLQGSRSSGRGVKYQVRAIRNKLETFARYDQWSRFQEQVKMLRDGGNLELLKQVIEYVPSARNTGSSNETFLHFLCGRYIQKIPLSLLETLTECSSHLLTHGSRTPLSIALTNEAAADKIECLVRNDKTRLSLYQWSEEAEREGGRFFRPLAQAVYDGHTFPVFRILVEYAENSPSSIPYESILLYPSFEGICDGSRQRDFYPLVIFVFKTFKGANLSEAGFKEWLPCFTYLLFRTYRDMQRQLGESIDDFESYCDRGLDGECLGDTSAFLSIMHAVIACEHLFYGKLESSRNTLSTFFPFFAMELITKWSKLAKDTGASSLVDPSDGNTLIHHAARSIPSRVWTDDDAGADRILMSILGPLLISLSGDLLVFNDEGKLPLHVALETRKPFAFLRALFYPGTFQICTRDSKRQFALHLLAQYPSSQHNGNHDLQAAIHEVWQQYPEANRIRDGANLLFPFQLAAMRRQESTRSGIDGDDEANAVYSVTAKVREVEQVSTIYTLLRADPQLVQGDKQERFSTV